jgi:hypothetical protein
MIDCINPSTDDIVIPKGLRMNHQPEELIIQKPGEADIRANKIVIPYGIANINYFSSKSDAHDSTWVRKLPRSRGVTKPL